MNRHAEFRTIEAPGLGSSSRPEEGARLEVNVVFTAYRGTLAALRSASQLARHLDARIRLIVLQSVPLSWSLDSPPVSLDFTRDRCQKMAAQCVEAREVKIDMYTCWDKWQALRQALAPRSLIVIGGERRWWQSREQKLARRLEAEGHRVVFADVREYHDAVATERHGCVSGQQPALMGLTPSSNVSCDEDECLSRGGEQDQQ